MTPESITVSLEMAKALKEAGFEQSESIWFWRYDMDGEDKEFYLRSSPSALFHADNECAGCAAAPTAEEILRELPTEFEINDDSIVQNGRYQLSCTTDGGENWRVFYCTSGDYPVLHNCEHQQNTEGGTLANAAAQMWIYLKENNLLPTNND